MKRNFIYEPVAQQDEDEDDKRVFNVFNRYRYWENRITLFAIENWKYLVLFIIFFLILYFSISYFSPINPEKQESVSVNVGVYVFENACIENKTILLKTYELAVEGDRAHDSLPAWTENWNLKFEKDKMNVSRGATCDAKELFDFESGIVMPYIHQSLYHYAFHVFPTWVEMKTQFKENPVEKLLFQYPRQNFVSQDLIHSAWSDLISTNHEVMTDKCYCFKKLMYGHGDPGLQFYNQDIYLQIIELRVNQ